MTNSQVILSADYKNKPKSLIGITTDKLNQLAQVRLPVPPSFCVSSQACLNFYNQTNLNQFITSKLEKVNILNYSEVNQLSNQIQQEIKKTPFPTNLAQEIARAYNTLKDQATVQLLISPAETDFPQNFMFIQDEIPSRAKGDANVIEAIKNFYVHLFVPELIIYWYRKHQQQEMLNIALLIQELPQVEVSGVLTTIDRVHGDKHLINLEAVWGLPDDLMTGKATPDFYQVEKNTWRIDHKHISTQSRQRLSQSFHKYSKVPSRKRQQIKLSDEDIINLAKIAQKTQQVFFYPQNVVWLKTDQDFYLSHVDTFDVPINQSIRSKQIRSNNLRNMLLTGIPASPGIATGVIKILKEVKDIFGLDKNEIGVLGSLPSVGSLVSKSHKGFLCSSGGQTSHLSVICREKGIPAVVGLGNHIQQLKNGQTITLNGSTGEVFLGNNPTTVESAISIPGQNWKTATKTFVYSHSFYQDTDFSSEMIDGLGWINSQSIIQRFELSVEEIKDHHKSRFVSELHAQLKNLAEHLGNRPVYFSLLDVCRLATTKNKQSCGAEWLIRNKLWIKLELEAFFAARRDCTNLHLILPGFRYYQEIEELIKIIKDDKPKGVTSPEIWVTLNTSANVFEIDRLINLGIFGLLIPLDELIAQFQGRDIYSEISEADIRIHQPAVNKLLEIIFTQVHQQQCKISLITQRLPLVSQLTFDLIHSGANALVAEINQLESLKHSVRIAEQSPNK